MSDQKQRADIVRSKFNDILPLLPNSAIAPQFAVAAYNELRMLSRPCTINSCAVAVGNAAVMGLIPGSGLGHCYFVPFRDKNISDYRCQLVIGYQGFLQLAYECRFLSDCYTEILLTDETATWKHWADEQGPHFHHDIPFERSRTYQNIVAAYCVWHGVAGGKGFKLVTKSELDKIKAAASKKGDQSLWLNQHTQIDMVLKTPIRRAAKMWQRTQTLSLAIALDERAERGDPQEAASDVLEALADVGEETVSFDSYQADAEPVPEASSV